MSSAKAALKNAKAALDGGKYDETAAQAHIVLERDPENYFGHVFLGRALEKQNKPEEAARAYAAATKIKPQDEVAWKGLNSIYEAPASRSVEKHTSTSLGLAKIYAGKDDAHECQSVIDKLIAFAKEHGSRHEYKQALQCLLPTSPVFEFLEGRIQSPSHTYATLAEITEADETERINREIGERRTRLGAKIGQVTKDVHREVYNKSDLETLYENIINWTNDDGQRRFYEEKLLQHAYDHLVALPAEDKREHREKVINLAHGMVIIKHPFKLAWNIDLEWEDIEDFEILDQNVLRQYVQFFPDIGLSKVMQAYFDFPLPSEETTAEDEDTSDTPAASKVRSSEEKLVFITDGIEDANGSRLAHMMTSSYYLHIEEYESCVEISRAALKVLVSEKQKSGLSFDNSSDRMKSNLATALVYYQSPKNHPEAQSLFDSILTRKLEHTAALLGVGLINEEQEQYEEASSFLDKALRRAPQNLQIVAEAAWCQFLKGDTKDGIRNLQKCFGSITAEKQQRRDLRAVVSYRIGKSLWDSNTDRKARKDRQGPYANFLDAIKSNPSFAPPYTALGLYYESYGKDNKRSRQCFQKAFELSASEIIAAEHLARDFAAISEWDIVEVVAQRAIDSGAVRPAPGSKRKPVSWPFSAMAIAQMNKLDFPEAVHSFQAALRILPSDYHAWIGLGESYLSSGRYNAASRALEQAESLADKSMSDEAWFARYMHANVHRELGEYDKAIEYYLDAAKSRPKDYGVYMALLETFIESASQCLQTGYFGQSSSMAKKALSVGIEVSDILANGTSFWKVIGDACSICARIPAYSDQAPLDHVKALIESYTSQRAEDLTSGIDQITLESLDPSTEHSAAARCFCAAVMAHKCAINASSSDFHGQSVAWYNLGWVEHHTYLFAAATASEDTPSTFSQCAKASVRCFKRAIELEAANPEFWNALGVVTTRLNPKVAQHSFIRSLHINERSSRTWVNLGALHLEHYDYELAHEAFSRAQSNDPDYVDAWLGEGMIALGFGDAAEALIHFKHAFEIADASDTAAKSRYAASAFDDLAKQSSSPKEGLSSLINPIFALQQTISQSSGLVPYRHLLALLQERAGDNESAVTHLTDVCSTLEAEYESSESISTLCRFIRSKCDLARNQLALKDFESAAENSSAAIDLSDELGNEGPHAKERLNIRLSAHLSAGLANYYSGDMSSSLQMFRQALDESDGNPDIICLLAKVLWAEGGDEERGAAKEQLLSCLEHHPGNAGAMTALGAMSALDGDETTYEAIVEDLQALRTSGDLTSEDREQVELLLTATVTKTEESGQTESANRDELTRSVMMFPDKPQGWSRLADETSDAQITNMALLTAEQNLAPHGRVSADKLSEAFSRTDCLPDMQRAIMLCPWAADNWIALSDWMVRDNEITVNGSG